MKKLLVSAIAISAIVLAGCGTQTANNTSNGPVTVKVGVIAPLSWPAAAYGEDIVNVVKKYVDAFNSSQNEYKIDAIMEDGKCSGKDATSAIQKLINVDNVSMIYGGACSSETLAAGKIAQAAKVFMLSAVSSAPQVSEIGDYVYRYYSDTIAAKEVASFINNKSQKIAIVSETTDFAQGFANAFKENFKWAIGYETTFSTEEKDFNIIAKNLATKANDIDFIMISNQSNTTMISIAKAMISNGVWGTFKNRIFFTVGADAADVKEALGNKREGLYSYNAADLTALGNNLQVINEFEKEHPIKSDKNYVVIEIEGIQAIIDGIKAGNTTSDSLKAYFDGFKTKNRNGIFGPYYFNEKRDAEGIHYIMTQIQSGSVATIE